jgi:hypothetical protein
MQPNSLLKAKQTLLAANLERLTQQTHDLMFSLDTDDSDTQLEKIYKIIH